MRAATDIFKENHSVDLTRFNKIAIRGQPFKNGSRHKPSGYPESTKKNYTILGGTHPHKIFAYFCIVTVSPLNLNIYSIPVSVNHNF